MTTEEFSDNFDTLVSSYLRFKDFDKKEELDSIEFDEFEKSVYLTMAQKELVIGLYTGKNTFGDSFEVTEEIRRYLDSLVKDKKYIVSDKQSVDNKLSVSSSIFNLPSDLAYIIYEQVTYASDAACGAGDIVGVQPVTHDEYNKLRRNPFRGPTRYKALRLDRGMDSSLYHHVEIVSKYGISAYYLRYLAKPKPIVLEDMPSDLSVDGESTKTECELNDLLHDTILKRAVQLALLSKGIQVNS